MMRQQASFGGFGHQQLCQHFDDVSTLSGLRRRRTIVWSIDVKSREILMSFYWLLQCIKHITSDQK